MVTSALKRPLTYGLICALFGAVFGCGTSAEDEPPNTTAGQGPTGGQAAGAAGNPAGGDAQVGTGGLGNGGTSAGGAGNAGASTIGGGAGTVGAGGAAGGAGASGSANGGASGSSGAGGSAPNGSALTNRAGSIPVGIENVNDSPLKSGDYRALLRFVPDAPISIDRIYFGFKLRGASCWDSGNAGYGAGDGGTVHASLVNIDPGTGLPTTEITSETVNGCVRHNEAAEIVGQDPVMVWVNLTATLEAGKL
jgi:hypothetical protein